MGKFPARIYLQFLHPTLKVLLLVDINLRGIGNKMSVHKFFNSMVQQPKHTYKFAKPTKPRKLVPSPTDNDTMYTLF